MRFLLEKSLISSEQSIKFDNMTSNNKLDFIEAFIKDLPNYRYLDTATDIISQSILTHGFNTSENKFLKYLTKVKWDLNSSTANIIYTLLENGNLRLDFDWLYNRSLYKGNVENVNYKLKALAYASNANLQANANKKLKPELLFDGNKIKSITDIKRILKDIETYSKAEDVERITGVDIIRNEYKGQYTRDNIIDYVLRLFPKESQPIMTAIFADPNALNDIKKILAADYTDKVLGDDVDSKDMLNDALISKLNELRNKHTNKINALTKSNKSKTGEQILRDAGISTLNELSNLAYIAAIENEYSKFDAGTLKTWVLTPVGKAALNKILNSKYQDSIVGSALDNIKMDISELVKKARDEISPRK